MSGFGPLYFFLGVPCILLNLDLNTSSSALRETSRIYHADAKKASLTPMILFSLLYASHVVGYCIVKQLFTSIAA